MPALLRFRREDIQNLRVGDVIRYQAIHQSRTGYLSKAKVRGTIMTLENKPAAAGQPASVEGLLRDRHGVIQRFKVTDRERVRRKVGVGLAGSAAAVDEGQPHRDAGNVAQ
jgi:hypothetical protein